MAAISEKLALTAGKALRTGGKIAYAEGKKRLKRAVVEHPDTLIRVQTAALGLAKTVLTARKEGGVRGNAQVEIAAHDARHAVTAFAQTVVGSKAAASVFDTHEVTPEEAFGRVDEEFAAWVECATAADPEAQAAAFDKLSSKDARIVGEAVKAPSEKSLARAAQLIGPDKFTKVQSDALDTLPPELREEQAGRIGNGNLQILSVIAGALHGEAPPPVQQTEAPSASEEEEVIQPQASVAAAAPAEMTAEAALERVNQEFALWDACLQPGSSAAGFREVMTRANTAEVKETRQVAQAILLPTQENYESAQIALAKPTPAQQEAILAGEVDPAEIEKLNGRYLQVIADRLNSVAKAGERAGGANAPLAVRRQKVNIWPQGACDDFDHLLHRLRLSGPGDPCGRLLESEAERRRPVDSGPFRNLQGRSGRACGRGKDPFGVSHRG